MKYCRDMSIDWGNYITKEGVQGKMEIDKQDIDIMIEHALANYNRRTIVLWGKYRKSDQIRKRLVMQYQIENILYVDSDKKRQNGKDVFDPNYIRNKKDSMYIVIPLDYYVEIAKLLDDGGYIKEKDYYYHYACDCINESEGRKTRDFLFQALII